MLLLVTDFVKKIAHEVAVLMLISKFATWTLSCDCRWVFQWWGRWITRSSRSWSRWTCCSFTVKWALLVLLTLPSFYHQQF